MVGSSLRLVVMDRIKAVTSTTPALVSICEDFLRLQIFINLYRRTIKGEGLVLSINICKVALV